MYKKLISFIRELYKSNRKILLHPPKFSGNEKKYLNQAIDSTFVSAAGSYIEKFENKIKLFTKSQYAIATVNGTSSLHVSLILAGVKKDTEVLTQSLTFVATCNAIKYCFAYPVFIDVDKNNLGMSPDSLVNFLEKNCELRNDGRCWNKFSNRIVSACLPMHTFGFPLEIKKISKICKKFNISLVEDAAAALGSFHSNTHVGLEGMLSSISLNGNKIITSGGGGVILTKNKYLAEKAKNIINQSKIAHPWEFNHNDIGYNYRMPNINAAIALAQIEKISSIVANKRETAKEYQKWANLNGLNFLKEPINTRSNYWLNALLLKNENERDLYLSELNKAGIMARPLWKPMHLLKFNKNLLKSELTNTMYFYERIINLPSGIRD